MKTNFQKGRRGRLLGGTAMAIACLTAAVTAANAQDTAKPDDNTVVVVTGSRLANRGFKAPTPVTVVDQQEVKLSGAQNLDAMLADTPQFTGSQLNSPTANTVQAGQPIGTATLNLRDLGPTRNLVLVNGRRFAITGRISPPTSTPSRRPW
ncbi:MAG: TonB-dependent receptor plug domain-containing protein [Asticcacaulis sp.]